MNLYNAKGELCFYEAADIFEDVFSGYDTIQLSFIENSTVLDVATNGKLYVTR